MSLLLWVAFCEVLGIGCYFIGRKDERVTAEHYYDYSLQAQKYAFDRVHDLEGKLAPFKRKQGKSGRFVK